MQVILAGATFNRGKSQDEEINILETEPQWSELCCEETVSEEGRPVKTQKHRWEFIKGVQWAGDQYLNLPRWAGNSSIRLLSSCELQTGPSQNKSLNIVPSCSFITGLLHAQPTRRKTPWLQIFKRINPHHETHLTAMMSDPILGCRFIKEKYLRGMAWPCRSLTRTLAMTSFVISTWKQPTMIQWLTLSHRK